MVVLLFEKQKFVIQQNTPLSISNNLKILTILWFLLNMFKNVKNHSLNKCIIKF